MIVARGFRETLEILFRFSKKCTSITVKVVNPVSERGRASVCPLAAVGRSPELLVLFVASLLPVPRRNKPLSSDGNIVTLMVGTLSRIGQKAFGSEIGPHNLPVW